ncbi:MAG TPA: NAD(P)-dependent oxidoreductase [Solirubrobacteraceae bacterium]|nr:NAD(P)-dependent oxidoreductase [Solirubrobacteraceae bacterium]
MSGAAVSRVGLLGTGLMGTAMAHRLLNQGVGVIAWDRNPGHARPLANRGADLAGTPADVVRGAEAVITMLPRAEIVLSVVEPLLDEWSRETIWLQMSSVGAAEADQLVEAAAARGVTLFDAPVSGSTHPAEEGQLTILASGPETARERVEPVFEALGSRVQWVGEAGMGSRLKLAANHWMIAMVAALAESMHLCQLMGLDAREFITLLDGGPLGSSYAVEKLGEMERHEYPAGFPVRLALKDLKLVREVASGSGVELPVLDAVLERIGDVQNKHGNDDLAAVYELKLPSRAER